MGAFDNGDLKAAVIRARAMGDLLLVRQVIEDQAVAPDDEAAVTREIVRICTELNANETRGTATADSADNVEILDGLTWIRKAPDHVPAVWGRGDKVLWSEGEYVLLTGPIGAGKTTLSNQALAGRLGLLEHVLGYPITPGERRVLLLALDRPPQIRRALKRILREADDDTLRRLKVVTALSADLAAKPKLLADIVRKADADSTFIDTVSDVAIKLSSDEVGQGIASAFRYAIDAGSEVFADHHHRKRTSENRKPDKLDDVYGSTWIPAKAGSVICLWGSAGDPLVELSHLKQPAADVGPLEILHDHARGRSEIKDEVTAFTVLGASNVATGTTVKEVAAKVYGREKPEPNQIEKMRRDLEHLVEEGFANPTRTAGEPVIYRPTAKFQA
jgi:replicative DNA helicase